MKKNKGQYYIKDYNTSLCLDEEEALILLAFVTKYSTAIGNDWYEMLLSAIKNGIPLIYDKLKDKNLSLLFLVKTIIIWGEAHMIVKK